jgi:hypothetical protein
LIGTPNQATIRDADSNLVGLLGIAGNDIQSIITGILMTSPAGCIT